MLIGSSGASLQLVEGTSKQHLPGNTNGQFEPHPPNKIPPPRFRSRLVHLKQTPENRTDNSMVAETSHAKMANVYLSELDEQDYSRHMDSSNNHSHSIGQQPWRTREGELVSHRDQQQHPLMSKINSYINTVHVIIISCDLNYIYSIHSFFVYNYALKMGNMCAHTHIPTYTHMYTTHTHTCIYSHKHAHM